jgi:hypothetical protein
VVLTISPQLFLDLPPKLSWNPWERSTPLEKVRGDRNKTKREKIALNPLTFSSSSTAASIQKQQPAAFTHTIQADPSIIRAARNHQKGKR